MKTQEQNYWIEDAGHSWLVVPLRSCKGIEISAYSYYDGNGYAYLEEDCDAPAYFRHHELAPSMRRDMQVITIKGDWHGRDDYTRFTSISGHRS